MLLRSGNETDLIPGAFENVWARKSPRSGIAYQVKRVITLTCESVNLRYGNLPKRRISHPPKSVKNRHSVFHPKKAGGRNHRNIEMMKTQQIKFFKLQNFPTWGRKKRRILSSHKALQRFHSMHCRFDSTFVKRLMKSLDLSVRESTTRQTYLSENQAKAANERDMDTSLDLSISADTTRQTYLSHNQAKAGNEREMDTSLDLSIRGSTSRQTYLLENQAKDGNEKELDAFSGEAISRGVLSHQVEIQNTEKESTIIRRDVMEMPDTPPQPFTRKRKSDCVGVSSQSPVAQTFFVDICDTNILQTGTYLCNSDDITLSCQGPESIYPYEEIGPNKQLVIDISPKAPFEPHIDVWKTSTNLIDENVEIASIDNDLNAKALHLLSEDVEIASIGNDLNAKALHLLGEDVEIASINEDSSPVNTLVNMACPNESEPKRLPIIDASLAPLTPEKNTLSEIHSGNTASNSNSCGRGDHSKDKQIDLLPLELSLAPASQSLGATEASKDGAHPPAVNSSVGAFLSLPKDGLLTTEQQEDDGDLIDLNKGPHSKPKRKRHRPKVRKEGCPVKKSNAKRQVHNTSHGKLSERCNSKGKQCRATPASFPKESLVNIQVKESEYYFRSKLHQALKSNNDELQKPIQQAESSQPINEVSYPAHQELLDSSEPSRSQTGVYGCKGDMILLDQHNGRELNSEFAKEQPSISPVPVKESVVRFGKYVRSVFEGLSRVSGKRRSSRLKALARKKKPSTAEACIYNEETTNSLTSQIMYSNAFLNVKKKKRKEKRPVSVFENCLRLLDPAVQCNASLKVPDDSGAVTDCWHGRAVCCLSPCQLNSNCYGQAVCCQSRDLCERHPQEQRQLVHQNIVQGCQSSNHLLGIDASSLSCQSYKSLRDPVDEIQERLQLLSLNEVHECSISERQDTGPFETKDETVPGAQCHDLVLYEGSFDPLKKRKIRPRVVLDSETIRVWNSLMGKRVIEANKTDDPEDKERHWEMERHIFKERAQNFIICMRQVQGDRRFSQWKGSVVDSVVGAFLTQNVSDHLSSSAFISLASRFPHTENSEVATYDGNVLERFMQKDTLFETTSEIVSIGDEVNHEQCSTYYGVSHEMVGHSRALSYPTAGPSHGPKINFGFLDDYSVDYGDYNNSSEAIIYNFLENFSQDGCHTGRVLASEGKTSIPADNQVLEELKLNLTLSSTSEDCPAPDNLSLKVTKDHIKTRKIVHKKDSVSKISGIARANIEMGQGKSKNKFDWETICKNTNIEHCRLKRERDSNTKDAVNWDAVRYADLEDIADAIKERGMNNVLAGRIKRFLEILHADIGSIDLEWLKDIPPDDAKNFLLSIRGLGLKSVECIRLLTLQQLAFPVDTNVGRICVRLGWVPIEPLPESVQIHLLEQYPVLDSIQRYLWPRLCTLDQRTLYELHYQLITFGKVFCTKSRPNCNACPMRFQCKHFASACASAKPALPAPHDEFSSQQISSFNLPSQQNLDPLALPPNHGFNLPYQQNLDLLSNMLALEPNQEQHMTPDSSILQEFLSSNFQFQNYEPIIEEPATPEHEYVDSSEIPVLESPAIEDDEIPTINLNYDNWAAQYNLYDNSIQCSEDADALTISRALVAVPPEAATIPIPKLKNISRLRTEHRVYEIPDNHQLLRELDPREPDDPCFYLLAIWSPDEMLEKREESGPCCCTTYASDESPCQQESCNSCTNIRDLNDTTVKGTLLIPCRTAMRGSFPLNGTYFQVNEVFADHKTSLHPIEVPRNWIWNLRRRTVYFGTSIPSIFKGLTAEAIQDCFWKGYVCVRGFERKVRAPRPLTARLHFPASKKEKSQKKTAE